MRPDAGRPTTPPRTLLSTGVSRVSRTIAAGAKAPRRDVAVSNLLREDGICMAIFGREREGRDKAQEPAAASTAAVPVAPREGTMFDRERSTNQGGTATDAFLGKGAKVTGTLVFEGTGRIEGRVEGEITAQDVLTIGDGATVNAKITGTLVIVEGHVTGDVVAKQRLELRASGRVHGNVSAPSLIVHEGAILDGQCSMGGVQSKSQAAQPTPDVPATRILDKARDTAKEVSSTINARPS